METKSRRWTPLLAGLASLPLAAIGSASDTQGQERSERAALMARAGGIQGVWDSIVTLRVCNSGPVLATFRALNLFEKNQSLIATSQVAQTPSLGVWQWQGGQKFRAMFRLQRFGADGSFEGVNDVAREIVLDPDSSQFTSTVSVKVYDIAGTLVAQTCGEEVATRVF
jgi:hypothetical protein